MSHLRLARSPDLRRLLDEGYELEERSGHLLVHHVPYVTSTLEVAHGTLVSAMDLASGIAVAPSTHVAHFVGAAPCDGVGQPLRRIINSVSRQDLGAGLVIDVTFSAKPGSGGYNDYYDKVVTYVGLISGPAAGLDDTATARTYRVVEERADDSPFLYPDTATARAGIGAANDKLALARVAIVGLGGTGSYLLDLIAKTPVREIHLFDGDRFLVHNAFRAPGAASVSDLDGGPNKAAHFERVYSVMRRGVVAHPEFVTGANLDQFETMDWVFIAMDPDPTKRKLVGRLESRGIPFIDVGMGIHEAGGSLGGIVRVASSVSGRPTADRGWIPLGDGTENDYAQNIQAADLNALNASLAVVRWKKHLGFYRDLEGEQLSLYTIDGNSLTNDGLR